MNLYVCVVQLFPAFRFLSASGCPPHRFPPIHVCLKSGMISRARNRHHLFAYTRQSARAQREHNKSAMEIHDDESLLGNYHRHGEGDEEEIIKIDALAPDDKSERLMNVHRFLHRVRSRCRCWSRSRALSSAF
jgi:hypothetical protein